MAVSIVQTNWLTTLGTATEPANVSVALSASADAVYIFGAGYLGDNDTALDSITLGGNAPDATVVDTTGSGTADIGFLSIWYSGGNLPASGPRDVDIDWGGNLGGTFVEGPQVLVVQTSGGQLSNPGAGYHDSDNTDGAGVSLDFTSATDHLILFFEENYNAVPGTPSGCASETSTGVTDTQGSRLSTRAGAASTTNVAAAGAASGYTLIMGTSIPDAGGGGGGTSIPVILNSYRNRSCF